MKKLLLLLAFLSITSIQAQRTFQGNVSLNSNQEIFDFAAEGYTEISGLLTIGGTVINLNFLGGLTSVGSLSINGNDINNIGGLENITSITTTPDVGLNEIRIQNTSLVGLSGLQGLTNLQDTELVISGNAELFTLNGLNNLTSINKLQIESNPNLTNIDALSNLTSITANNFSNTGSRGFLLADCFVSDLSPLSNLTTVNDRLWLRNLNNLTSLSGLQGISILGEARIDDNTALLNYCALQAFLSNNPNFTNWGAVNNAYNPTLAEASNIATCSASTCPPGAIILRSQEEVDVFGLNNCTVLTGNLTIQDTGIGSPITNLNPLNNLTEILGDLNIIDNPSLVSLDGLQSLNSTSLLSNNLLNISNNPELTSITALSGLTNFTSLSVIDNNKLISLQGLNNITLVGNRKIVVILRNDSLIDLSGLESLTTLDSLFIRNNNSLESLSGIDNLESILGLFIVDNTNLGSLCAIQEWAVNTTQPNFFDVTGNAYNPSFTELQSTATCSSQNFTLIPDPEFERYLADNGLDNDPTAGQVLTTDISGVTTLDIQTYNIIDFTGLEDFTALEEFSMFDNLATTINSIDFNANPNLRQITVLNNGSISEAELTGIDITNNVNLEGITIAGVSNNFNSITIGNKPNLTDLLILETGISSINLSGAPNINGLFLSGNSQITALEVSNLTNLEALWIGGTSISSLDLQNNVSIERILADNTVNGSLTSVNLRNGNNGIITSLVIDNNPNLTCVQVDGNIVGTTPNGWILDSQTQLLADCSQNPCQGNVILTSQEEVDTFGLNNCTIITGDLTIQDIGIGNPITNLNPLNGITEITGALIINGNTNLVSLDGLQSLTQVNTVLDTFSESLSIANNPELTSIEALSGITQVNELSVNNNPKLTSLEGLHNITVVDSGTIPVIISNNESLLNLNGLRSLTQIFGLAIINNNSLIDLNGLGAFTTLEFLDILNNDNLASLNGLENINVINNILIASNSSLTSFCALQEWAANNTEPTNFAIFDNAYNPSFTELQSAVTCSSQNFTEIPDPVFEAHLENIGAGDGIANNGLVSFTAIQNITLLEMDGGFNGQLIQSLQGIEAFSILETLDVSNNQLTTLALTSNTSLLSVKANNNQISSVSFDTTAPLQILELNFNNLTAINIGNMIGLEVLSISENRLTSIDLSNNVGIEFLDVSDNLLTTLDIRAMAPVLNNVNFSLNQIPSVDLSTATALSILIAFESGLTSLNLKNLAFGQLSSINVNLNPGLNCIEVSNVESAEQAVANGNWTVDPIANIFKLDCGTVSNVGDFVLHSQEEVDAFGLNNFTIITGDLTIQDTGIGSPITNLTPLNGITEITGSLSIDDNPSLVSLDGLQSLSLVNTFIDNPFEDLSVARNPELTSIEALSNITQVNELVVFGNDKLSSLEGLHNITQIFGQLVITNNNSLIDLNGLRSLIHTFSLTIVGNNSLIDLNLNSFATTTLDFLDIVDNDNLATLDGLESVTGIGFLDITNNDILIDLNGLSSLASVELLSIRNNNNLTNLNGLDNVTNIIDGFFIRDNTSLTSFCALQEWAANNTESSTFEVLDNAYNPSFTELQSTATCSASTCPTGNVVLNSQEEVDAFGLNNCTVIPGRLTITNGVTDLTPLSGLISVGSLFIRNTNNLTNLRGLENISNVPGLISITQNAALVNAMGLEGLTNLPASIGFFDNPELVSLQGLNNLNSAVQVVTQNNPRLTDYTSLSNLNTLQDLFINDCPVSDLNFLSNLTTVTSGINFSGLTNLTSLNGLEGLTTLGNISIEDNTNLTNFCALQEWAAGTVEPEFYTVTENGYNPSFTELQSTATCSSNFTATVSIQSNGTSSTTVEEDNIDVEIQMSIPGADTENIIADFNIELVSNSAEPGSDYTSIPTNETFTYEYFNDGLTVYSITILDDINFEATENFTIRISNSSNNNITLDGANDDGVLEIPITIIDNDYRIDVQGGSLVNENGGASSFIFTLTDENGNAVSNQSGQNIDVQFLDNGDAQQGSDYNLSGTGTIANGQQSTSITITGIDDNFFEGEELVLLEVQEGSGYYVDSNALPNGAVGIEDNDNHIALVASQVGLEGSLDVEFIIRLQDENSNSATIATGDSFGFDVTLASGTGNNPANINEDFVDGILGNTDNLIFIEPQESSVSFQVAVIDDTLTESQENFLASIVADDNRLILDNTQIIGLINDNDAEDDADGDGVLDNVDNCPNNPNADQADLDNDTIGDICDPDIDGDGILNTDDAFPNDSNESMDTDGDGIGDNEDNCPSNPNADQADLDNDTIGDICDPDIDGDGVLNTDDAFPNDSNESMDTDGDGIGDNEDNCPNNANADQADADGDGIGDACESANNDADNDGILDNVDNCPNNPNTDQADLDNDGIGDVCDSDIDGDGILNVDDAFPNDSNESMDTDGDGIGDNEDNCPNNANTDQADADGDGIGDVCESADNDADNDGILDNIDNCPSNPNADQADLDNDGIGDVCDSDIDGDGILNVDDDCPEEAGTVEENGCPLEVTGIALEDIEVLVLSETCPDQNNGSFQVSITNEQYTFNVFLNGALEGTAAFGVDFIREDLADNDYELCLTITELPDFQQCFGIRINTFERIAVDTQGINSVGLTATFNVAGSREYEVRVNNTLHRYQTSSTATETIEVPLEKGTNSIIITGQSDCQGIYSDTIQLGNVIIHPNPLVDVLNFEGFISEGDAQIMIYTVGGQLIVQDSMELNSGMANINLSQLQEGLYLIRVITQDENIEFKIIKE